MYPSQVVNQKSVSFYPDIKRKIQKCEYYSIQICEHMIFLFLMQYHHLVEFFSNDFLPIAKIVSPNRELFWFPRKTFFVSGFYSQYPHICTKNSNENIDTWNSLPWNSLSEWEKKPKEFIATDRYLFWWLNDNRIEFEYSIVELQQCIKSVKSKSNQIEAEYKFNVKYLEYENANVCRLHTKLFHLLSHIVGILVLCVRLPVYVWFVYSLSSRALHIQRRHHYILFNNANISVVN